MVEAIFITIKSSSPYLSPRFSGTPLFPHNPFSNTVLSHYIRLVDLLIPSLFASVVKRVLDSHYKDTFASLHMILISFAFPHIFY